ncbi:MAG TPA: radical SAM protein [Nitrospirae bacterium]|nr:radical SAM protein [Nitrospirota bacterium]
MKPSLLLVNPYIYDFSAFNLWAYPLGLLKTAEFLSKYEVEIKFIDCLETIKYKDYYVGKYKFERVDKPALLKPIKRIYKRYGISEELFIEKLKSQGPFDIVLITSIMTYWYPGVQRVIELIKKNYKDIPIILGGLYPTLYHQHAIKQSGADAICIGRCEDSLDLLINSFGFNLKKKTHQITPFYKLSYPNLRHYAPLITSSGCPFNCSYCASSILNKSFQQRSVDDVIIDIEWFYNHGFSDIAFYDDALLVNPESHIKEILRYVIKKRLNLNFHCPNGLHAKYIDEELAELMWKSGFKTLTLGFETVNTQRQLETGGKTTRDNLTAAISNLISTGFTKQNIGVYLMYGLINQPIEEVKEGIAFLKDLKVKINLTEYSPIKGTKMWSQLVDAGILDDHTDPIVANNTIFSELFWGYPVETIQRLKQEVKEYNSQ